MLPSVIGCSPAIASSSSRCPLPAIPAMPNISPLFASKDAWSSVVNPSLLTQVTSFTISLFFGFTGSGRSISNVTFSPTIISVSVLTVAWRVGIVPTYFPLRSTVTLSERSSTSCNLWVIMIIALPSSRILRSTANSFSASCGVNTAVGSSKIRIFAPRYSIFTISTVCFWETDIS